MITLEKTWGYAMRAVVPIAKLALAALVLLVILVAGAVGFVYSAPETATRFAFNQARHSAGLLRREIDLPGGLHYVYLEGGKGEPLMLLHGFGADKDNFVRVARYLTPVITSSCPTTSASATSERIG